MLFNDRLIIEYDRIPEKRREPGEDEITVNGVSMILMSISWGGDPIYIETWGIKELEYYRRRHEVSF